MKIYLNDGSFVSCNCNFPYVFAFYDVDAQKVENFFVCSDVSVAERNFYSTISGYPPMIANAYNLVMLENDVDLISNGVSYMVTVCCGSDLKSYLLEKGLIKEKESK